VLESGAIEKATGKSIWPERVPVESGIPPAVAGIELRRSSS
jgi:hypothetical protein